MTVACPCGSPAVVRHGTMPRRYLRPCESGVEKVPCEASRFQCKACGRTFTALPAHAVEDERRARELVAELTFLHGRSGAGRRTGLGEAVVDGLLDRWQREREVDVADAAPDFILLDEVRMRDGPVILVADVDRESLVEATPGVEALSRWLARPDILQPLRACVPVDAALAATIGVAVPGIRVMVAPSSLARAIRTALAAGLASLRRDPSMGRRNAFPGVARFLRALDGRVAPGDGWPLEVLALLSAGKAASAVASAPDAAAGLRLWPEYEMAASVAGGAPLRRLMGTWRDAILAGLDHRFVDRMSRMLTKVRRTAAARRPTLLARDFRALALLRDHERAPLGLGLVGRDGATVAAGRRLACLPDLLAGREPGLSTV